jgi:NAD(P)-dependent dehydrogenase (short-subunit alcohol dehydrogenase family)
MGDKQITVNCIAPGGIRTDMYHKVCREYIPNGANLNDAEVDEVREIHNWLILVPDCENSMLRRGVLCTVSVFQSMLRGLSVSLLARTVNGSTERCSELMEQLACRTGVIYHNDV